MHPPPSQTLGHLEDIAAEDGGSGKRILDRARSDSVWLSGGCVVLDSCFCACSASAISTRDPSIRLHVLGGLIAGELLPSGLTPCPHASPLIPLRRVPSRTQIHTHTHARADTRCRWPRSYATPALAIPMCASVRVPFTRASAAASWDRSCRRHLRRGRPRSRCSHGSPGPAGTTLEAFGTLSSTSTWWRRLRVAITSCRGCIYTPVMITFVIAADWSA